MKNVKKEIFSLIISFSFTPQILWATLLYRRVAADSYVMLNTGLLTAFAAAFIEIAVFSSLTSIKRFYATRVLLLGAYVQLFVTAFPYEFKHSRGLRENIFAFAAFGAVMAVLNAVSLYYYKKHIIHNKNGE